MGQNTKHVDASFLRKDNKMNNEEIKVSEESGRIELSISEYASQADGEAAIDAFVNAIYSMLDD